ncbi:hypothetical protein M1563_00480 [Patescibacteria group bacterium]|nr:hypothetical protein [Patescibacteria group bacterium]
MSKSSFVFNKKQILFNLILLGVFVLLLPPLKDVLAQTAPTPILQEQSSNPKVNGPASDVLAASTTVPYQNISGDVNISGNTDMIGRLTVGSNGVDRVNAGNNTTGGNYAQYAPNSWRDGFVLYRAGTQKGSLGTDSTGAKLQIFVGSSSSDTTQTLTLDSSGNAAVRNAMYAPTLCLGSPTPDCRSVWPSATGGGYWSRNAASGYVYPTTTSDNIVLGNNYNWSITSNATSNDPNWGFGVEHPGSQYFTEAKFWGAGNNQAFRVLDMSNGTTPLFVGGGGNVGLGTNNPVNRLQVEGNIHTDGGSIFLRGGTAGGDQYDVIKWNSSTDKVDIGGYNGVTLGPTSTSGPNSVSAMFTVDTRGPAWGNSMSRTETMTDANNTNPTTGYRSGFYQSLGGANVPPSCAGTWCHVISDSHENTNYALQLASGFFNQDDLYYRDVDAGAAGMGTWKKILAVPANVATPFTNMWMGQVSGVCTNCATHVNMTGATFKGTPMVFVSINPMGAVKPTAYPMNVTSAGFDLQTTDGLPATVYYMIAFGP